jgi:hypothetical protein
VAIDPDIAAFYSTDVYGVSATFTHGVTVATIVVIFDRAGAMVTVGGIEAQTAAPQARCKATDVSTAANGDTLAIGGTTYYVSRSEPLNNDETLLHLSKDA